MNGVNIIISGLVQGVGFRYYVQRKAEAFGITGTVRNLFTGEVEIEAFGTRAALEQLINEVKIGPRSAAVRDLKIRWMDADAIPPRFEVR